MYLEGLPLKLYFKNEVATPFVSVMCRDASTLEAVL